MVEDSQDSRLTSDVDAAVAAFCTQLRTGVDGSAKVPNLDWTVAELGAHLACLPSLYRTQHELGAEFTAPADWSAFSNAARAHVTERDLSALATMIKAEIEAFLADIDDFDEPRWLYGRQTTARNLAVALFSEATMHGNDLRELTGAPKRGFDRRQGNAVVDASMRIAPAFVDPAKVAKLPDGIYHLRFRGGNDYTYRVQSGALTIEDGRVGEPDAIMNADPATFAMVSLGRGSRIVASLTGRIVVYGRKPWRFVALGAVVVDGV